MSLYIFSVNIYSVLGEKEMIDSFSEIKVSRDKFLGVKDMINYYNNYNFDGKEANIVLTDVIGPDADLVMNLPSCFVKENDEDRMNDKKPLKEIHPGKQIHNVIFEESQNAAFYFVIDDDVTKNLNNFDQDKYLDGIEEIFLAFIRKGFMDLTFKKQNVVIEEDIDDDEEENKDYYIEEICKDFDEDDKVIYEESDEEIDEESDEEN